MSRGSPFRSRHLNSPPTSAGGEFGVWEAGAPEAVPLPSLEDSLDAEVGIVGAGYTGLSTALHLAERGIECVVVEAHEPGHGASGRNAGWMQPDWWHKRPADVVGKFGRDRAESIIRWLAGGPELLESWIRQHRMSAGFDRRGLLQATARPDKLESLEATVGEWRALGANVEYVGAEEVRHHVSAARYCGGAHFRDGAIVNPLALSRELARACVSKGVRIFAGSPVRSASSAKGRWLLGTERGELRAQRFVLATDAYTESLSPALSKAFATLRVAVLGSEPYPGLAGLLPTGRPFADMSMANMFSLRPDGAGRLVTSTLAPVRDSLSPAMVAEPFMRKFRRVFPDHEAPNWRYLHCGAVGVSSDLLPRLCAIGENAWTAYGYSGAGINAALLMGGELARRVAGQPATTVDFPVTRLDPMRLRRTIGWGLRYVYTPLTRGLVSRFA